jgi:hypothetical protein
MAVSPTSERRRSGGNGVGVRCRRRNSSGPRPRLGGGKRFSLRNQSCGYLSIANRPVVVSPGPKVSFCMTQSITKPTPMIDNRK